METKNTATAKGTNLPVSNRQSKEVCEYIRGRDAKRMQKFLSEVIMLKVAVPYKWAKMDLPHRKGRVGPGRYPIKVAKLVLELLNSAIANAENKGMKADDLFIKNAISNKGPTVWHSSRLGKLQAKRTHIEIILQEKSSGKKKAEAKTAVENKTEVKEEKAEVKATVKKPAVEKKTEEKAEVKAAEEKPAVEKKAAEKKPRAAKAKGESK